MKRDPLDERMAQLFAAAREEPASEITRQRIVNALRTASREPVREPFFSGWTRWGTAMLAAALVLGLLWTNRLPLAEPPISVTPESLTEGAHNQQDPIGQTQPNDASSEKAAAPDTQSQPVLPPPTSPSPDDLHRAAPRPLRRPPVTLEQELAGVQRARAALDRGDAQASLAELDRFGRERGWNRLDVEAGMLRIEALAGVGRSDEARKLARRFVEQHPNNPLVDRARRFAAPAGPSAGEHSVKKKGN